MRDLLLRRFGQGVVKELIEINRSEVLLSLLRGFTTGWEENVLFGDRRWQWENMKVEQGNAKHILRQLSDAKYPDFWKVKFEDQLHLLCDQLRRFVKFEMRDLSLQELESVVAHGRMAYEMTRRLIPVVEANQTTWCLCGHSREIHNDAVCLFSYNDEGFPFDIDCECPSFRAR